METYYNIGQRVKRRPIIRKLGAMCLGMEQTPIVFDERLILIESASEGSCSFIRAHDYRNDIVYPAFGQGCYFASGYTENGVAYAFATTANDDKPLTMYQDENAAEWHDPRGGQSVMMFWSTDLKTWQSREALQIPHWRLWNTSVCKGPEGYVMAIEVRQKGSDFDEVVGHPFTSFFARSADLMTWELMDTDCHYTRERYNACPALRYSGGWYYMICLEALPVVRYAPYIYRTRNFRDWEVGFHNPMMIFGDEDRIAHPLSRFTDSQLDLLERGLNINNSDVDLCEFEGKTYLYYATGDQMQYAFLCEAVYDGAMDVFLRGFFE